MSGEKSGVEMFCDKQPKAIYAHCALSRFGNPEFLFFTANTKLYFKSITLWIKNSPKREGLVKEVLDAW